MKHLVQIISILVLSMPCLALGHHFVLSSSSINCNQGDHFSTNSEMLHAKGNNLDHVNFFEFADTKESHLQDGLEGSSSHKEAIPSVSDELSSPSENALNYFNPPDTASVSISISSGANPSCNGAFVTFMATPINGGSSPSYQWQLNGINVGSNSPYFTSNALATGHVITCIMTSNLSGVMNNPATSNAITMTVPSATAPTITIATTNTAVCPNTLVTFTAAITNGGNSPSYQWKKNGNNIGTNQATYSSSSLITGDLITCVLSSNSNCATTPTATSNSLTMTVSNASFPTPSVSISVTTTSLCNTPSVTFTANTTNSGFNPSFQWKVNGVNAGTNSPTFTSTTLLPNDAVSCTMTAIGSCPTIATVGSGTNYNTSFSSIAFFPTVFGNGRQQYLIRASELTALGVPAGYIQSLGVTLTFATGSPDTLKGYTLKMATTSVSSVTSTFQSPTFTTVYGPVNYTPTLGALNSIPFTTPFYWNGTSNILVDLCFSNLAGGSLNYTHTISTTSFISCTYYAANGIGGAGACSATSGNGTGTARPNMTIACSTLSTFNSNSITMIGGGSLIPTVTISTPSTSICPGSSVTFTATTTNGGTPTYQWKVNGSVVGSNSPTYTNNSLTQGAIVTCTITSSLICATPTTATSNALTMTLNIWQTPSVTIQAAPNNICVGQVMTFNATPGNGGPSPIYQWKLNNINVGTNSSTYTNLTPVQGDVVKCVMTTSYVCPNSPTATSNSVTSMVNAYVTPSVTISASVNNVCPGTLVNITSNVINGGTFSGQWKINGNNVVGSFPNYVSTSFANGDVITYQITSYLPCTFPSNMATSNAVTMNILNSLPPVVTITPATNPVCIGSGVTVAATAVNPGINAFYQWKLNGNNVGTNSLLYTSPPLANNDVISCEYTSTVACPNTKVLGLGTNITANNFGSFFPTANGNGKQQYLLKASELLAIGLTAGNIHSLAVDVKSTLGNPSTLNDYTIRMAHTTVTTLTSTFQTPSFTTVFGPVNYTPTVNTLNTLNFTLPFNWDGLSNIIVELCFSNQGTGSVAYKNTYSNYTYTSTTLYQVNGVSPGVCSQVTGSQSAVRPNFTITSIPIHTVNSNSITMGLTPLTPPAVSIAVVQGGNPTCNGANVTFLATPTLGGSSPSYQWKINGVNVGGTAATFSSNGLNNGDVVTCQMTSNHNCVSTSLANSNSITMMMSPCSCILTVKALIEGYYLSSGNLTKALYNQGVETNPSTTNSDSVIISLHQSVPPYAIMGSYIGLLQTDGTISCLFPGWVIGNNYYIVFNHRNSLQTWSALPHPFEINNYYDFSIAANKAYGNNLTQLSPTVWGVYSGDITQDLSIDAFDYLDLDPDIIYGASGYIDSDLNGDGVVDAFDYLLLDPNLINGISALKP